MTQTYKVQVSMNQAHIVDPGFTWKQGDFGFNIEIEVLDFDTSGVTAQIIFRKSSGAVESTSLTQSSNKFTYTVRGTELDTPGPCICDLKLKNSTTQRISTASFKYFTIPDTMNGLEEQASSYSDTIEQVINEFKNEVGVYESELLSVELVSQAVDNFDFKTMPLVKDMYWGNGGLQTITTTDGIYYAANKLLEVKPGDYIIVSDWGLFNAPGSAFIGMYNSNGGNNPGRVNFNNTSIVVDYKYDTTTRKIAYAVIKVPAGCTRVGLFIKTYSTETTAGSISFKTIVSTKGDLRGEVDALADFKKNEFKKLSDLGLTEDYYWGNGGRQSISPVGDYSYRAANTLISVTPGDHLVLKDFYSLSSSNAALIGMYDANGNDAPGRVNANSEYVKEITVQQGTIRYADILIPPRCTQVGLFVRCLTSETDIISTYRVGEASYDFEFTDQAKKKIKELDIDSDYYIKGESSKLERTAKLCIIGAGQSNIDGRVPVSSLPSPYSLPMSGMKYKKNELDGVFDDAYPSGNWGFDTILCYYLIQNLGADNLYYIKWSEGNTSIDPTGVNNYHWTADYEKLYSLEYSLLMNFNKEINKCNALNAGDYQISAMIWHQGEGDRGSYSLTAANNYYDNLKKIIAYCRGIVGNSRLPFVLGTISHNSEQYDETIDAAIRKIAAEDPYVWLVDMQNAGLLDPYHFNAAWSEYFGKKAYDCLIDAGVITGTKLNPSEPS